MKHEFLPLDTKIDSDSPMYWIASYMSKIYGVFIEDLKGKSRKPKYVIPRHLSMHFMKEYNLGTQKEIGQYLGGRDHSTVIHGLKNIKNLMETQKNFNEMVLKIEKELKKLEGVRSPESSNISQELQGNIETFRNILAAL